MLDLHTHSTASDGQLTPANLVRHAKAIGLVGIALTDHDTMAGVEEAQRTAAQIGLRVMPGVEISSEYNNQDVHILGYFVEITGPLPEIMRRAREARIERVRGMVQKLCHLGINITFDEVVALANEDFESLGRPHVGRLLVNKGVVKDLEQAFELYLERGRPAFVPRFKLSPGEAVKAIVASKGVAVWAHPGSVGRMLIDELVTLGLAGLEVFHPSHSLEVEQQLADLAREYSLVITGGSDAHEASALGGRSIGDGTWDEILKRKRL